MSGQQVSRLSAAGYGRWLFLDTRRKWFGASCSVNLSSGATLTYTVQHTFDNLRNYTEDFSVARVGTTLTITRTNHGLSVGDWSYIEGASAPITGEYQVASVVDANNYTVTVSNSGATTGSAGMRLFTARVFPHAVLAAQTASADSNYAFPPSASRLYVSAYTGGFADYTLLQQGA